MNDSWEQVRALLLDRARLVRAVASGRAPGAEPEWRRVEMRPVVLSAGPRLQVTRFTTTQAFTANHEWTHVPAVADDVWAQGFGQWVIELTDERVQVHTGKSGRATVVRTPREEPLAPSTAHDRPKERLLPLDSPVLHQIGITTASGQIRSNRQDKLRQVDEFLRLLWPALEGASLIGLERPLRVLDLGCGNAYLTFVTEALLTARHVDSRIIGIDVKDQSRRRNAELSAQLGVDTRVSFLTAPIADAPADVDGEPPDVVMALHACDTASDDAIASGVRSGAKLILVAPCCHHDLQRQLDSGTQRRYPGVLRYGILRERMGDVLTDTVRAEILRLLGFRVDVVEFIGSEHTPRNLLIRAVRTGAPADGARWGEYDTLVAEWGITPQLAELLEPELAGARPEVKA